MKRIVMGPIEVSHPERRNAKILIPGGWNAFVGEVTLDKQTHHVYASYLGSAAAANEIAQKVYESGFLAGLRHAIQRRALEYAKAYPDLVKEKPSRTSRKFFVLRGFDPEKAQSLYVPFDNVGREGKAFAAEMLAAMAAAARKAAA